MGLCVIDDCVNSIYPQQVVSAVLGEIYSTGCVHGVSALNAVTVVVVFVVMGD
jgi:hypothetical protein